MQRQNAIHELKEAAERAAQVSEARLNQKARMFAGQPEHSDHARTQADAVPQHAAAEEIDRVAQDSHDFSLEFGQGGKLSAGERLELGRRLARNRKLGELARLVGRFKQDARALRRQTLDRGVAEAYDIERGAELGRLIPAELLALHHPGLQARISIAGCWKARCCNTGCARTSRRARADGRLYRRAARRCRATRSCGPRR